MNTKELSRVVADKTIGDPVLVDRILRTAFSTIKQTVKKCENVNIANFGTFQPVGHTNQGIESDDVWNAIRWASVHNLDKVPEEIPQQWSQLEFYPTNDWKVFGEVWSS